MKTIYDFKKFDEVVRVSPSKPYSKGVCDRSYMGKKLIYVGITNGNIYLKRTDELELRIFGSAMIDLPLDMWDDGWDFYTDPNTLFDNDEIIIDSSTLDEQLQKAINNEDYDLANKIKKIKENINNKK